MSHISKGTTEENGSVFIKKCCNKTCNLLRIYPQFSPHYPSPLFSQGHQRAEVKRPVRLALFGISSDHDKWFNINII